MTQGGSASKRKKRSSSQRTNVEEQRKASKISANQILPPDINFTSTSTKTKRRLNSNRTGITKREEGSLHSRKRKEKIGYTLPTKEQSLPKRVAPRRRNLTVHQEDEGSSIDFEKRSPLTRTDIQGPTRKRVREATCNAESQLKTLTKPKKLTKSRYRFLPNLTNIKEENSSPRLFRGYLVDDTHAAVISDKEKDKSKLQRKEIHHKTSYLDRVETNAKRRSLNIGKIDKARTRKLSLKEKSRAGKHRNATKKLDTLELNALRQKKTQLLSGSHGLHSLIRKSTLSRVVNNTVSINVHNVETVDVKVQDEVIEKSNRSVEIDGKDMRKKIESKETAKALKVANDTSGFVRTTLKAVEDSKSISFKVKEGMSKKKKEDVNINKKPNKIAELVAERYKITLEALQSKKTLTAHALIEELETLPLASKGNATKRGKLGKTHTGRLTRTNLKKDMKDGSTGREMAKESAQSDVINDGGVDTKHIKLGRKTKKGSVYQMIDKLTKNQGLSASKAAKKSKSPMVSGFHRLVSGAREDKEFESALAQIVSSHDGELGWTNEQEKALQDAYLSIKQKDGDFWHVISKEVPGRNAKQCYDRFCSSYPTPAPEAPEPATKCPKESAFPSSLSSETKNKGTSLKVLKMQKHLEGQKTIRNISRHVDDKGGYETNNNTEVEIDHPETMQDVQSVLERMEHDHAVILQSHASKDYSSVASHLKLHGKAFFDNVVISGASSVSDKENNQPRNGQDISNKKLGVPRVELTLKQAAHGEHFPYDGGPKTTSDVRKKKIIKSSKVYLHSKDALDFGDSTLDAIQLAKEELRNVFSRTGSTGGSFFYNEAIQIAE